MVETEREGRQPWGMAGVVNRLHQSAGLIASRIGLCSYNTVRAAADFRRYLEAHPVSSYPAWEEEAAWLGHAKAMDRQSGSGNPLAPLVIVGSELSAGPENHRELYFKTCFDLFWQEVFGLSGHGALHARLRRDFLAHWAGAGTRDKVAGGRDAPFYRSLRAALLAEPSLWEKAPFVARQVGYHSNGNRGAGHQWAKAAAVVGRLLGFDAPEARALTVFRRPVEAFARQDLARLTVDDFVFFTESSLEAAAAGQGKAGPPRWNGFVDEALANFSEPRIWLVNPTHKGDLHRRLRERLAASCEVLHDQPWGRFRAPLALLRHRARGHRLVLSPVNLTQAVPQGLLDALADFVREAARGMNPVAE